MKKNNDSDISFLGKILLFFHNVAEKLREFKLFEKIKKKQRSAAHLEDDASPEEARISYFFGWARTVTFALLCILLCLTLIFGGGIFSYENVYYMFKDIQYVSTYGEARAEQLNYSRPMARQDFSVFKNGLAVASDSELKLFTSTGRVTMTRGSEYSNPKLSASDSSILVYDQGNRDFSVYNSFTELYRERLDFPISSASMSDVGTYTIVTKNEKYRSCVRLYDKHNELKFEYCKNDYIISAQLSQDGALLAVLSLNADGGKSEVTLTLVNANRGAVKKSVRIDDSMPYSCQFLSNDRIVVFSQSGAYVYNTNLAQKSSYSKGSIMQYAYDDTGFVLITEGGGIAASNTVIAFNKNGQTVMNQQITGDVRDVKIKSTYAYVLTDNCVYRFDTRFGTVSIAAFSSEDARLAVFSDGSVAVCTDAVAYYVTFE